LPQLRGSRRAQGKRADPLRPAFPILFWGIGVVVHYLNAYRTREHAWIDRETERILRERDRGSEDRQEENAGDRSAKV
jgi:hypothetical protein